MVLQNQNQRCYRGGGGMYFPDTLEELEQIKQECKGLVQACAVIRCRSGNSFARGRYFGRHYHND